MPRFSNSIFNDPNLHGELSTNCYAVRTCLCRHQVEEISAGFDQILKVFPERLPNLFWPSGQSSDPTTRNKARDMIGSILCVSSIQFKHVKRFVTHAFLFFDNSPKKNSYSACSIRLNNLE